MFPWRWLAVTAVGVSGCAAGAQTPLAEKINALIADPAVSRAHWGVAVTALDGTPGFRLNEAQYFRPASNNKLYTTAAAMALLGPESTYDTRIFGKFDAASGTVTGDLVLRGGGDANFGGDEVPYIQLSQRPKDKPKPQPLHDLEALADQVAAKGVKHIAGNVVGDDTLFPFEPYADSWGADDLVWGYGAPVSALTIADNQLRLSVSPGKAGFKATVTLEQNGVAYYTVLAEVETRAVDSKGNGVQIERRKGSKTVRVYGAMAEGAKPDIEYIAIEDPAEYAAMALRGMLIARGITVDGPARAEHKPVRDGTGFLSGSLHAADSAEENVMNQGIEGGSCLFTPPVGELLASHTSPSLSADIVLTNKVSQNLHAELIFHHVGRRAFCGRGSTLESARMVRAFLLHAGLDGDDFVFYDGSGLSSHDLTTPRATAKLLAYASTQPWFAQWKTSLPIGGEDGSMIARYPKPPLKDHVFAKTGTLGESRALSGYLDCASGKTVIFSVMVDTHTPATTADRDTMDKIVAAIAEAN